MWAKGPTPGRLTSSSTRCAHRAKQGAKFAVDRLLRLLHGLDSIWVFYVIYLEQRRRLPDCLGSPTSRNTPLRAPAAVSLRGVTFHQPSSLRFHSPPLLGSDFAAPTYQLESHGPDAPGWPLPTF